MIRRRDTDEDMGVCLLPGKGFPRPYPRKTQNQENWLNILGDGADGETRRGRCSQRL